MPRAGRLGADLSPLAQPVRWAWVDIASGTLASRPQLDELLDRALPGDTLVVWRLDRLGRSLPHLIEAVRGLGDRGIGFRSVQESIDTTTATGQMLFHIMGALAQFERDLLSERTKAGLVSARDRGRVGGRPSVMTPDKLDAARTMVSSGKTISVAAKTLGVSRATLYQHLGRT